MNLVKKLIFLNLMYLLVVPIAKLGDIFPKSDIGIISLFTIVAFIPAFGIKGVFGWFVGLIFTMTIISTIYYVTTEKKTSKFVTWCLIILYFIFVFIFNAVRVDWGAF